MKNFISSSRAADSFDPVTATDRVTVIDALRGFALFGVLTANLYAFSLYYFLHDVPDPVLPMETADNVAVFIKYTFMEGKFYSIFSLLFGIGFAIQLQRAKIRKANGPSFFRRRLLILLGIGLVHLYLIWPGDILVLYALLGFFLLIFRGMTDAALLRWTIGLLLLPVLFYIPLLVNPRFSPATPLYTIGVTLMNSFSPGTTGPAASYMDGSWREFITANAIGPVFRYAGLLFEYRPFKVLAMFILGLWLGRHILPLNLDIVAPLLRRIALWGFGVGIPANVALAILSMHRPEAGTVAGFAKTVVYALGVVPLALAYVSLFGLLWRRTAWRTVLSLLVPAGRMALTNYLMQSLIGISLFYGIGLGWGGKVGPALLWPLAVLIYTLQLLLSHYWLRFYQFGPMEWLWRSLTYRSFQQMRIQPPATAKKEVVR